jgi:Spy/CpxP family protein refolding chaperone
MKKNCDRTVIGRLVLITLFCSLLAVSCKRVEKLASNQGTSGPTSTPTSTPTLSGSTVTSPESSAGEPASNVDCSQKARKQLNLTPDQKKQMRDLEKQEVEKVKGILDDSQKQTLQKALESGESPRKALKSLTLSGDQKKQLRPIVKEQKRQLVALLTPEQQSQIKTVRECKQ